MSVQDVHAAIDDLSIDWDDMESLRDSGSEILDSISLDPLLLGSLVDSVRDDPAARVHHETHRLLNKFHLYESPRTGVRLRLHLATLEHRDRPHDHRWSFCSKIISGAYVHTRHEVRANFDDIPDGLQNDFESEKIQAEVRPTFQVVQEAGSLYALHHEDIHTTFTTPGTVSLFLRGPAQKEKSVIVERSTGTAWWRYGRTDESADRRNKVAMSSQTFDVLANELKDRGVLQ